MTKEELKDALIARGVKVHHLWKEDRLQREYDAVICSEQVKSEEAGGTSSEPQYTEEEINNIAQGLEPSKPFDEAISHARRYDDGVLMTDGGILIPDEVLIGKAKSEYSFSMEELTDKVLIYKHLGGERRFVREYEKSVHGEGYRELAEQFCKKNNKLDLIR